MKAMKKRRRENQHLNSREFDIEASLALKSSVLLTF